MTTPAYTHEMILLSFEQWAELRDRGLVPLISGSTTPSARAKHSGESHRPSSRNGTEVSADMPVASVPILRSGS